MTIPDTDNIPFFHFTIRSGKFCSRTKVREESKNFDTISLVILEIFAETGVVLHSSVELCMNLGKLSRIRRSKLLSSKPP